MKIGIIHDSLNFAGGAERVCLKTLEALKEAGHYIILGTLERTNWNKLSGAFGPSPLPDREFYLFRRGFTSFRFYASLLSPFILSSIRDMCKLTICTNEDLQLLPTSFGYIHYLPLCLADRGPSRIRSPLVDLYSSPYKQLQRGLLKNLEGPALISNSRFTQEQLERSTGLSTVVIYPPVETQRFVSIRNQQRTKCTVLSVGRFSPERNFEISLSLARLLPEVRFVIFGAFSGALSSSYYSRLVRTRDARGLRNVAIFRDRPHSELLRVLASSTVLLDGAVDESFGLAVVEAMAAGLVPLVHRSGGPWKDILGESDGTYGFSYSNVDEAAEVIARLLADRPGLDKVIGRGEERLKLFSDTRFKQMIADKLSF